MTIPADEQGTSKRRFGRLPERAVKPIAGVDDRRGNAWPTGPRTIACLWCDRAFLSSGRHERMCHACRRHSA